MIKVFFKKVKNKRLYKRSIRLAVVGNTAAGKTYFLEDVNTFLVSTDFGYSPSSNVAPFSYISNFPIDARNAKKPDRQNQSGESNLSFERTLTYACRHNDQYCVKLSGNGCKEYDFRYLDIPGEAISQEKLSGCNKIYNELKNNSEKNIWLYEWKDPHSERIYKTVSSEQITIENIGQCDEDNKYKKNINTIRPESYSTSNEFLPWFKEECGKFISETKVSGKYFIENYYDIVPDSSFDYLCRTYQSYRTGFDDEKFGELASVFYFYYFLFQATDIVIIVRKGEKEEATLLNNTACLRDLKDAHKYLGIKGVDAFFEKSKFSKHCNNVKKKNELNSIYSTLAKAIGGKLYNNQGETKSNSNNVVTADDVIIMTDDQKVFVNQSINGIVQLVGSNKKNNIPRHTYFLATPITKEYNIDTFKDDKINGSSFFVENRMFFGSLQLIEDVMLMNGKKLPDEYKVSDDFLNFIRGNDKH